MKTSRDKVGDKYIKTYIHPNLQYKDQWYYFDDDETDQWKEIFDDVVEAFIKQGFIYQKDNKPYPIVLRMFDGTEVYISGEVALNVDMFRAGGTKSDRPVPGDIHA